MSSRGFTVTRHYLGLATAWRAEYKRGVRGRTVGVNAEMDALPGIGHACGHNLIAMAGVGIALALRAALEKHDIAGTIVLLGTPGACVCVRTGVRVVDCVESCSGGGRRGKADLVGSWCV
jgi:metal-dependent amidase/aminoacylase/carboxypeptidase family protein